MQLIYNYLEENTLKNGLCTIKLEFLDKPVEVVVQTKRTSLYEPNSFKFRGKLYALIYSQGYTHLREREIHIYDVLSEDFENFWNYKPSYLPTDFTSEKSIADIISKRVLKTSDNKEIKNLFTIGFNREAHEIISLKLEDTLIYQRPMKLL